MRSPVMGSESLGRPISTVSGPDGAAVQDDYGNQPGDGNCGKDFIGPCPLKLSRLRFDEAPVNTLAYPAETGAVQAMQGLLLLMRVFVLFEVDGNAEKRDLIC